MNASLENYPAAEMRASDADRDSVLSELSEHFQAGRLTAEEFDERAGQALAARTHGELRNLLRDLPAARPGPQAPAATSSAAAPPQRPSWPALLPVAALAGIAIAVAVSVGVAHHRLGFLWLLLLVLFVARRVGRCTGASKRSGVARL
jgi:hypothetical protein